MNDCCDRSPSERAYTAWYNANSRGVVTLCAHHAREHGLTLIAQGFELSIDERETLDARAEVAT